jgi:hypothetical protein
MFFSAQKGDGQKKNVPARKSSSKATAFLPE